MPSKKVKDTAEDLERKLEQKLKGISLHDEEDKTASHAKELSIPYSDLSHTPIDSGALSLLSEEIARSSQVAIILKNGTELVVASTDPESQAAKKVLGNLKERGFTFKLVLVSAIVFKRILERYGTIKTAEKFEIGAIEIDEGELDRLQKQIVTLNDLKDQLAQVSITRLLEISLAGALKTHASDVHIEPELKSARLRYRIDGILQEITTLERSSYEKIVNRIKIVSKLKLNVRNTPQDGRFTIRQGGTDIEMRVSILPSEQGETIVMRLLDPRLVMTDIEGLGMRKDILDIVIEQVKKPSGAILTTGPTGSGKTTSLYAFVNYLNTPNMKIITIEDPIEYHVKGISQTQVDPEKGYTFANGLRAIVRQDPNVLLIGEIRDLETADIALHAALTGHLVFSTIHTNDASGTIPRLIDLGIKPETIAPAITLAMGQRLVRRLCTSCKKEQPVPEKSLEQIRNQMEPLKDRFDIPKIDASLKIYGPGECHECSNTGYKGRIGVYEAFVMTPDMERLIIKSPAISEVHDLAVKQGMVTILEDGYLKLFEGITSLEEIRRILG